MQLRKVTNFEATNTGLNKLHLITNERWIAPPKDSCKDLLELSITCWHVFLNNNIKFHIIKTYRDGESFRLLSYYVGAKTLVTDIVGHSLEVELKNNTKNHALEKRKQTNTKHRNSQKVPKYNKVICIKKYRAHNISKFSN